MKLKKLSRRQLLTGLVILLALVIGIAAMYVLLNNREDSSNDDDDSAEFWTTQEYYEANTVETSIVESHNTLEDCWVAYDGKVYSVGLILGGLDSVSEESCGTELVEAPSNQELERMEVYYVVDIRE